MSAGAIRMGRAFVEIGADPSKLFRSLQQMNRRIGQFGAGLRSVGSRMMAAGAAMAAPLVLASRTFASFDDAIRATAAVTGATGDGLQRLTDKARHLGETTSFTASQVANLMTELGRAGFSPDEIIGMTEAVLDLARATGTDASLSAKIMGQTMRQFGIEAEDATRVADVLTQAANSTNTTVEDLGEALKMSGIQAAQAGLSLEETTAILGALGNVGLQGTMAGTSLRRLLNITAAEATKMGEIFGVNTLDNAGNVRPIIDIFEDIAAATESLPSGDRIARFNKAFGLLGVTGAQAIGGSIGNIRDLVDGLNNAEGTANRTAKAMDAGLGGSSRIAMSAIEGLQISIGEALAPTLMHVLDVITNLARGFSEFVKNNEEVVVSIAKAIAAVVGIGAALYGLGVVLGVASWGLGILLTPLILIPALIVGAVGGLLALSGAFEGFGQIASTTFGGIYEALAGGDLTAAMEILWEGLWAAWMRGVANFMTVFEPWIDFVQNVFSYMVAGILTTWDGLANGIAAIWDNTQAIVQKGWNWLKSLLKGEDWLNAENAKIDVEVQRRADEREAATTDRFAAADEAAAERLATSSAANYRQAADEAEAALDRRARRAADSRTFGAQAAELLANIQKATTLDQLRDLYGEYDALNMNGKLSSQQAAAIEDALDDAQERITKSSAGGIGGADLEDKIRRGVGGGGGNQSDVVGTFSANVAGMGFGQSLAQKQVDLLGDIADNTGRMADEGAAAAMA